MSPRRIALVGDHAPAVPAHVAIPRALALAADRAGQPVAWDWVATERITDAPRLLTGYAGVWCVPASPYRSMAGALAAIRFARESGRAFLGTCGGFQHAVIEFARNAAGLAQADHAEANPGAMELMMVPLACSLVEEHGLVAYTPGSRLAAICGAHPAPEPYHCRFGPNPAYRPALEAAGLRFTGFDAEGQVRAFELPTHPFFCGTLFQPERAALTGKVHPLVQAFVAAALAG